MKEEKIMILTMLEEGKITSEEAIKLLEALEDETFHKEEKSSNFKNKKEEKYNFKETLNSLEDIGSDIGNVLSSMFDGLMDIGSSLPFKYNYETTTTTLDMSLADIENPSLDLRAINGEINLRPSKDENLSINVICQYKKGLLIGNEPYFNFNKVNDKIIFSPNYNRDISIKLDVFVPERSYNEIKLNTSNGKIEINNANSNIIKAYTTNSNIILENIKSKDIDAKTGNSKIILNNITSDNIVCKTSNSTIDVKLINAAHIFLLTSNGKILLNQINTSTAKDINLTTSNNSIIAEINGVDKVSLFDLETSMGNIDLDIKDLIYTVNKQINLGLKKIVAHNENYDSSKDHLNFVASTSNGSINIH